MLKKIYFVYTIIITLMAVWLMLTFIFGSSKIEILSSPIPSNFFEANALGILAMTLCAIKLQKKNENYFVRIIPFFLLLGMIANLISGNVINIKGFDISGTIVDTIFSGINNFITYSYLYLLPFTLLMNLEANNNISSILKKIGYVSIVITFIATTYLTIKTQMMQSMPNLYTSNMFSIREAYQSLQTALMVAVGCVGVEAAMIILGFLTNYCFESDTISSEDLTYEELIKQQEEIQKMRENNNLMNISNTLTEKSNVGVVNKETNPGLKVQNIDKNLITMGPVVNDVVNNEINTANTNVPQVVEAPATTTTQVVEQPVQTVPAAPAQIEQQPVAQPSAPVQVAETVQAPIATQPIPTNPVQPSEQVITQPTNVQ